MNKDATMKLVKTLLATTLAFTAFSTFAATVKDDAKDKESTVIASSQENPVNSEAPAASPSSAQPSTDIAVEESTVTPSTAQPAQ